MAARSFKRTVGLNGVYTNLEEFVAGQVIYHAGSTAPTGFLACNGAAVSRTTYATLFGVIGSTYGAGDGATTFNLPDLRGEFLRGLDSGRGIDTARALGSAQTDAMQGHKHQLNDLQAGSAIGSGAVFSNGTNNGTSSGPVTDGASGAPRTAAETRPRNVAMLPCIKYS